jgi:hypothetical protein
MGIGKKILNLTAAAILACGLGLEASCATIKLPKLKGNLLTYYNSLPSTAEARKKQWYRLLQEDEYVLPDEVFEAYAITVDKDLAKMPENLRKIAMPFAGYIEKNYVDTKKEKKELLERLEALGLSQEEIAFYFALFAKPGIIIIREGSPDKYFVEFLLHERFHKKLHQLERQNKKEYMHLMKTGEKLIERGLADFLFFNVNAEEFFAHLAFNTDKATRERIEKILMEEYPKAYKIYNKIKEEVESTIKRAE